MDVESFRAYCLTKPGTTEAFPFDEQTLVFKVMSKIYALTGLNAEDFRVNLKAEPEMVIYLREHFDCVLPGYHMNKKHWNTILFESGEVSDQQLTEWIDLSYESVAAGLKKSEKELLYKI